MACADLNVLLTGATCSKCPGPTQGRTCSHSGKAGSARRTRAASVFSGQHVGGHETGSIHALCDDSFTENTMRRRQARSPPSTPGTEDTEGMSKHRSLRVARNEIDLAAAKPHLAQPRQLKSQHRRPCLQANDPVAELLARHSEHVLVLSAASNMRVGRAGERRVQCTHYDKSMIFSLQQFHGKGARQARQLRQQILKMTPSTIMVSAHPCERDLMIFSLNHITGRW